MKRNTARDATVGIVVLLAALVFTIAIFSIGSEQRVWVRKVNYNLLVPEANGLQSGSPVRLAGVQVGTVTRVNFSEDPNILGIQVGLAIDQAHQHRIRQDTVAVVKILTLLGGEKYVELRPGDPELPIIPPGSFIEVPRSFGMEQLGELSADLSADLKSISGNIRIILETVQRQEGVIGRMLLDPNFGQEVFSDIGTSARLARERMEEMSEGRGLLGRIVADEAFARRTVASIDQSLQRIDVLLAKATEPGGVVERALDPNGKLSASMDNLHQTTADMQDFAAQLKEGRGLLGKLVSDEAYGRELLGDVKRIADNLAAITDKLNKGEGTLGSLINDPQLIEDLKKVVRGVQNSKMMSWLIRHYREKGEEAQEEAIPAPQPDPGGP